MHAGIDAGPVIFQDGDYFGRTVNTAARIAARAKAGEVLVSDGVRGASTIPAVTFHPFGQPVSKGSSCIEPHPARPTTPPVE